MFFRKIDETLTIDKINFSSLSPLEDESEYFPQELIDCISNAVVDKNVNALKHILETVQNKSSGKIVSDRVIDQIYFTAVLHDFSRDNMEKLFNAIPININRIIKHIYQGMCQPPELQKGSLLHFAVNNHNTDMVDFLLEKGVDFNLVSHKNETPQQELERILAEDYKRSNPYNLQVKERMLESLKTAKARISFKF